MDRNRCTPDNHSPEIVYFHRNRACGPSIERSFRPLIEEVGKTFPVREFHVPCNGASPVQFLKNIYDVFCHRTKTGINHITGDIHYCLLGLVGCKSVLTIHDDYAIVTSKNRIDRILKRLFWFYLPVKIADKVACISRYTKARTDQLVKNGKTEVLVNHSVDTEFKYVKKQFNKECPVILQIGTIRHKNLETTLKAIEGLNCRLRVISEMTEEQHQLARELKIDYSNAYCLSNEEMVAEYAASDIVVFPSLFEGFGMPIIEGQATGRVVITSDRSPMREVAGNGAVLLKDPLDEREYRNAIRQIINDDVFREDLIGKGLENVNRYTIENASCRYIKLYNDIVPFIK